MSEVFLVKCDHCAKVFLPSENFQELMRKCINQGRGLAIMTCPSCHADIFWKPTGAKAEDAPLRCPVSRCSGWVSYIDNFDDGDFWGCGECGSVWRKKESLMREISAIQKKYAYRKTCYQKQGANWIPADPKSEAQGYDDLIFREEPDTRNDFDHD